MAALLQLHADDPLGLDSLRLGLHPLHRQLTRMVCRLRQDLHLLVLTPARLPIPDVIDRAADDQPEGIEASLLHQKELVYRQVAREEAAALRGTHAFHALASVCWDTGHRCW